MITDDKPTNCVPCGGPIASEAADGEICSRRHLINRLGSRRTQRRSAAEYLLQRGDVAPNFQLQAVDGSTMQLSDFRGKKVMVCFYRHPFCPICAYTVNNLIGHYKKVCARIYPSRSTARRFIYLFVCRCQNSLSHLLPFFRTQLAWASNLEVLTIFMASSDEIKIGIKNNLLPIEMREKEMLWSSISAGMEERASRDNRRSSQYPFHALADPDGMASSLFRVGRRNLVGSIKDALPFKHVVPIIKAALVKGDQSVVMLPSEFLIDEKGIIVDLYRAKTLSETIPMERVNCFLLGDKCLNSRDLKKAGRSSSRIVSKMSSKRSSSMYSA